MNKSLPMILRFTTLYTFPPLYTQKPAARRVFVFAGVFLFFTKRSGGKQRTCPMELLFPVTTPPVKMQARKVRRLSGLALYQNTIPLMIARAQRRLFKSYVPIRPDSPQSSAGPRSCRCLPDTARPPGIPPPARCHAPAWGRQAPACRRAAAPGWCAPGR